VDRVAGRLLSFLFQSNYNSKNSYSTTTRIKEI